MELAESTWTVAAAEETSLAVVPVGSTEQHGPHAPLGTDTFTAEAVARAGIESSDERVMLGPAIPVGLAEEHRHYAGSLWVSDDTFRAYVRETCESLAHHGWDRIVLVNGHGGNVNALREVCGTLTRNETAYTVPFTWFDAVDLAEVDDEMAMGHGGPVETSLLRAVRSDLVDAEQFDDAAAGAASQWGEWHSGVNLAFDTAEFAPSGVVGDPTASSTAQGEALLEDAAEKLGELLEVVATRDVSRPESQ